MGETISDVVRRHPDQLTPARSFDTPLCTTAERPAARSSTATERQLVLMVPPTRHSAGRGVWAERRIGALVTCTRGVCITFEVHLNINLIRSSSGGWKACSQDEVLRAIERDPGALDAAGGQVERGACLRRSMWAEWPADRMRTCAVVFICVSRSGEGGQPIFVLANPYTVLANRPLGGVEEMRRRDREHGGPSR